MVIAITMSDDGERIKGLPDLYHAQRGAYLVEYGLLSSQENVKSMRFSEVKIA